jgi:hypothetical protein
VIRRRQYKARDRRCGVARTANAGAAATLSPAHRSAVERILALAANTICRLPAAAWEARLDFPATHDSAADGNSSSCDIRRSNRRPLLLGAAVFDHVYAGLTKAQMVHVTVTPHHYLARPTGERAREKAPLLFEPTPNIKSP